MKYRQKVAYSFSLLLIFALITLGVYENAFQNQYIRFHVVANSDSPEDQALKLRIRDKLLERFGSRFANIDSVETGRRIIKDSIDEIKRVALLEIKQSGKSYPVKVQFGRFSFPTKAYGHLVLPAGEYEALKVVIGKGEGANWWCVMFPPLCFIDISHGVAKPQEGRLSNNNYDSQHDMVIQVKGSQTQQKTANDEEAKVTQGTWNKENEVYKANNKAEYRQYDDKWSSDGVKDRAAKKDNIKDEQDAYLSYDEGHYKTSDRIEYRLKLVEWIRDSSIKIKRLFSFLNLWD